MKNFIKVKENFVCVHCGYSVLGNGYTNHCPRCLFSLHVDQIIAGDRGSDCFGIMEPVKTQLEKGRWVIYFRCLKCGKKWKNKASPEDSFEELLKIER